MARHIARGNPFGAEIDLAELAAAVSGVIPAALPVSVAEGGTASATAGDARTALGVVIGTNVQAQSAALQAVADGTDLPVAAGGTGSSTAADARTALGLAIGSQVEAYNANLAGIDQDVSSGASPAFDGTNITNLPSSIPSDIWDFSTDSATKATIQTDLGCVLDDSDSCLDVASISSGVLNLQDTATKCDLNPTETNSPPYFYKRYQRILGQEIEITMRVRLNAVNYYTAHALIAKDTDDPWLDGANEWVAGGVASNFGAAGKETFIRRGNGTDVRGDMADVTAYNWYRLILSSDRELARFYQLENLQTGKPTAWTYIDRLSTLGYLDGDILRIGPGFATFVTTGTLTADWTYFEVAGATLL